MKTTVHLVTAEIEAAVAALGSGSKAVGSVDLMVRRPGIDEREVLDTAELAVGAGLIGDDYVERGSTSTPDGRAHPEAQLNIMNSRFIDAITAGDRTRWQLAGDQFFVDLDLSRSTTCRSEPDFASAPR